MAWLRPYGLPTVAAGTSPLAADIVPSPSPCPCAELGARKPATPASGRKKAGGQLARGSGGAALLGPEARPSEGQLDGRQHNGHAAELAIELLGAAKPAAAEAEAAGQLLVERIASKLSAAGAAAAAAQVGGSVGQWGAC